MFFKVFDSFSKLLLRCLPSSKVSPKQLPNASKMLPRASQDPSKRLQERAKRPQDASNSPQDHPNDSQISPKRFQEASKMLQEASKRLPRGSQEPPRGPQTALSELPETPKCLPGDPLSINFQTLKHHQAGEPFSLSKHLGQRASPII